MSFHMLRWDIVSCYEIFPPSQHSRVILVVMMLTSVLMVLFRSLRWVTLNLHKRVYSKMQKLAHHFEYRSSLQG